MSVDSFFFIRDDRLPTVQQWQSALDSAGVGIVLGNIGDLRKHSGYLPAKRRELTTGFEWVYGSLAETYGGDPLEGLGDRGHVIDVITHSRMDELVCGIYAVAVLAQLTDGLYLDEDSGELVTGAAALEIARKIEQFA